MLFYYEFSCYTKKNKRLEKFMKLLLCSSFVPMAKNLKYFFNLTKKHNVLFVWYADSSDEFVIDEESSTIKALRNLNFNIILLNENYEFNDKIDIIYVKGGNTTKLIHKLKEYNQFEKIRQMVLEDVVYVGQSAGSVLAGSDTEWTLRSEPYDVDLKKLYGKDALKGYNFVGKLIFVHCSKFRYAWREEIEKAGIEKFRVKNTLFYGEYLKDKKLYGKNDYIVLKDNQALYVNNNVQKIITDDWSKLPVLDEFRVF